MGESVGYESVGERPYAPRYERSYGSNYVRGLDVAEIAKLVRRDIKAAIAAGEMPDVKTSVRISRFSGGRSLDVKVVTFEGPVYSDEYIAHLVDEPHVSFRTYGVYSLHSEAATKVLETIKAIVESYNYDGSDTMTDYFDVNFYSHVYIDHGLERASRDAAMAAYEAAKVVAAETAAALAEEEAYEAAVAPVVGGCPDIKACPRCGVDASTEESVDKVFGFRVMRGKRVPQSHCRSCRREAARDSARRKREASV